MSGLGLVLRDFCIFFVLDGLILVDVRGRLRRKCCSDLGSFCVICAIFLVLCCLILLELLLLYCLSCCGIVLWRIVLLMLVLIIVVYCSVLLS